MTIPESPYQRLIDVIDLILVKNETSSGDKLYLHVTELSSLPQSGSGAKILVDILNTFRQRGLLPSFGDKTTPSTYIPKLDKVAEKKLLAERRNIFDRHKSAERRGEISLKDYEVSFDDDKATIMVGTLKCPLPPFKNEHFFCRAMFQHPGNEPVDWSLVFKEMTGSHDEVASPKKMRPVQDTMYAINNRIKEVLNTPDTLFTWENNSIKRNF